MLRSCTQLPPSANCLLTLLRSAGQQADYSYVSYDSGGPEWKRQKNNAYRVAPVVDRLHTHRAAPALGTPDTEPADPPLPPAPGHPPTPSQPQSEGELLEGGAEAAGDGGGQTSEATPLKSGTAAQAEEEVAPEWGGPEDVVAEQQEAAAPEEPEEIEAEEGREAGELDGRAAQEQGATEEQQQQEVEGQAPTGGPEQGGSSVEEEQQGDPGLNEDEQPQGAPASAEPEEPAYLAICLAVRGEPSLRCSTRPSAHLRACALLPALCCPAT